MNKHLLLIIAAMAFGAAAPGAAALEGNGTAESPYQISTLDDLKAIATINQSSYSYYILMNDIDVSATWKPLFPKETERGRLHFDGNGHVISNMTYTGSYASLFGNMDGSVKNLGVKDCEFYGPGIYDPSGLLAAYAGFEDVFTAEGCFAIGTVTGFYAGGLIGGTKYGARLSNCYSAVDASSVNGLAGGLCAAVNYAQGRNPELTIENCFVEGSVYASTNAGGILGGNQFYGHPAETKEILNITNAVVLSEKITCGVAANAIANTSSTPPMEMHIENVYVYEDTRVNGKNVNDGVSYERAVAEVLSWPAFTMNDNGDLCLRWEMKDMAGVSEVTAAGAEDAPAVYYNLQGVKVDNPANGIYIVRRGNKAYKALVK